MTRRGFTLVEVIVALLVGSIVLISTHQVFVAVADGASRLTKDLASLDRMSNGRRWLVEAFRSVDVSEALGSFVGRSERVEFGTWMIGERGWFERRRVALEARSGSLLARWAHDSVELRDSVSGLQLDYLLNPGANETWVREWISAVSPPLAVRLRITLRERVDTLLLLIGPGG